MNDCSNGRLVSFLIEGDDVISCEVCLEPFQIPNKQPKVLPCGHNFCDQCLFSLCCHQQYYFLDSIKCPTCRRSFPTNVAIEAPTNWELCRILEKVKQGREMNVTVIHVPDNTTATRQLSSNSPGPSQYRRTERFQKNSQSDRCGDCSRKFSPKILGKVARFCQRCNTKGTTTFYCLECCVNKHNGHLLLSLSELQTEQLKILGELRELRRKLVDTFQLSSIKSDDFKENSGTEEEELSDGLTSLDNAIQHIESTTIICPKKLNELHNQQIQKCSRLFSKRLITQEKPSDISVELRVSTAFPGRSTSRSSCLQNNGSLNFILTFLPENQLGCELASLIKTISSTDTVEQLFDSYIKAAMIITNILYDDIPLEQLSVFANALLQCFHQANVLSRKITPISKTISRKTVWKRIQMSYTELLRLGAKNYLSYEPERIALLDDLAYLCYLFADVCDQATVTICMIEAARARVATGTLKEHDHQKTTQRLKEIDDHLLECRRLQKLQDLRTTKPKKTVKLKQLWKYLFRRCSKSHV